MRQKKDSLASFVFNFTDCRHVVLISIIFGRENYSKLRPENVSVAATAEVFQSERPPRRRALVRFWGLDEEAPKCAVIARRLIDSEWEAKICGLLSASRVIFFWFMRRTTVSLTMK